MSERQKVLFVRLDLLPVQLVDQYQNSNPSLSEFIYYLKTNEDMIEKMRELIVVNGNLSYLTGISHGSDILSLNKEEIQKWIEGIKNHSDYQTIIFYLENLTDAAAEVINLSESVLVTAKDTAYENLKIKEWQRQMECMGINMNADKFQFIRLQEEKTEMLPISMNILTHSYAWGLAERLVNS
jgi:hypothetical protein